LSSSVTEFTTKFSLHCIVHLTEICTTNFALKEKLKLYVVTRNIFYNEVLVFVIVPKIG